LAHRRAVGRNVPFYVLIETWLTKGSRYENPNQGSAQYLWSVRVKLPTY